MKEGVIDVLMYIFSSYADQDENLPEDRASPSSQSKAFSISIASKPAD